jgi:hypothetical protein
MTTGEPSGVSPRVLLSTEDTRRADALGSPETPSNEPQVASEAYQRSPKRNLRRAFLPSMMHAGRFTISTT